MRSEEFYQSRRQDWNTLNELVNKSQRNIHGLSPQEVQTLARLYRITTSDLALVQRDFPNHPMAAYLNQLVARAHAVIYRGEPLALKRLIRFVTTSFPRLYRETWIFTFSAFLMFIIPALVAGISTSLAPETSTWMLPANVQSLIPDLQNQKLWIDIPIEERPYASSFIMRNNIQVSFMAYASGITGGILTLYILVFNGLTIGGMLGLTSYYGVGFELWNFIIAHGVIELSVIFMAGGSGLMLGWALLRPGLMRRRDALTLAARRSVRLLIGAVPLLFIAGAIEGFISPSEVIPWPVKWGVGITSGILLYSYLLFAGHEKKRTWEIES